jgi:hypothetical protein
MLIPTLLLYSVCSFDYFLVNYQLGCVPKYTMCDVTLCDKDTKSLCFDHRLPAVASRVGTTLDTRSMSLQVFFKELNPPIYDVVVTKSCDRRQDD